MPLRTSKLSSARLRASNIQLKDSKLVLIGRSNSTDFRTEQDIGPAEVGRVVESSASGPSRQANLAESSTQTAIAAAKQFTSA